MDFIYLFESIVSFLFDHIGLLIGAAILFLSVSSARKKAKRAAEQEEQSGEFQQTQTGKTFRDIMAEIQAELESESEQKPWADAAPKTAPIPPKPPVAPGIRGSDVSFRRRSLSLGAFGK